MEKEVKPLKIKAEIMWAYLHTRNELSNAFQVDLCNLSDAAVKALSDMGIEANHKDGKGFYITGKSKNFPIEALRTDGSRYPEETKIGNGSKATVIIAPYEWKFKNKKGVSASIKKLVINELVEYTGSKADDDAVDVDGDINEMESDVL
jgi:maltodextrin utilization protein YvdJ